MLFLFRKLRIQLLSDKVWMGNTWLKIPKLKTYLNVGIYFQPFGKTEREEADQRTNARTRCPPASAPLHPHPLPQSRPRWQRPCPPTCPTCRQSRCLWLTSRLPRWTRPRKTRSRGCRRHQPRVSLRSQTFLLCYRLEIPLPVMIIVYKCSCLSVWQELAKFHHRLQYLEHVSLNYFPYKRILRPRTFKFGLCH